MKKIFSYALACLLAMPALSGSAKAESTLELLKDIEVHGFATSSYSYNLNKPSTGVNALRVYDTDDNAFKFDNGELVIKKDATNKGDIGFRTDLTYGFSQPEVNKSSRGPNVSGADVSDDEFDVQIAYVSYNAPIGNGLRLDFGKFATNIGSEVMDGYDGFNYNFSRTFAFSFGPFTHTGIRANYAVNDMVGLQFFVANGQDNTSEDNDAKSIGAQVSVAPMKNIALYFNYFGGPEVQTGDAGNSDDFRNFFDFVGEINFTDSTLLNVDVVYGSEDNALGAGRDAEWFGFAGILRHDFNSWFSLNLRGEYYDDQDGFRSGTVQELVAFTITPEFRIHNNFVIRGEYRHDDSDANVFDDEGVADDSQDTIALNALFYF